MHTMTLTTEQLFDLRRMALADGTNIGDNLAAALAHVYAAGHAAA